MIYIVRHGKTELNQRGVLQGRSNSPLNEEGVLQAKEAAKKLQGIGFAKIYSSPLIRAVQTAKILVPGMEPVIDERLIEMDYGPYEGTSLKDRDPKLMKFFSDFVNNPAPDGMEQLSAVVSRCGDFLEDIKGEEGNILISTHAIAMKGLLEYLTPGSKGSYWSKYIGNCAVYAAELKGGRYGVPYGLKDFQNFEFKKISKEYDEGMAAIVRSNLKARGLDIPGTAYFDDMLDHLSSYYDKEGRAYYILLRDGILAGGIGIAEFEGIKDCCELQKLYLRRDMQGNRAGYRMVEFIEEKAKELGYSKIYLETHTNLAAAIHIYEKLGYQRIDPPASVVHSTMNRFYLKEL